MGQMVGGIGIMIFGIVYFFMVILSRGKGESPTTSQTTKKDGAWPAGGKDSPGWGEFPFVVPIKTFRTKVVGVTRRGRQPQLRRMLEQLDDDYYVDVELVRDPNNKHDPNAIKVINEETGKQIGFISAGVAVGLAKQMDAGYRVVASVVDILGAWDEEITTLGCLLEIAIYEPRQRDG